MPEDGFKNRNLMPEEKVEWITSTDAQKPALIIKALLAREPDFFKNQLSVWEALPTEQGKLTMAKAALETCESLKIYGLYNTMFYFWMSTGYGIYFHKDMRWGYNIELMEDFAVSEDVRMRELYRRCETIYEKAYIGKDNEKGGFEKAEYRFLNIDLPAQLPAQIEDPTKFMEDWCRILWPEFIDVMPDHYFQRMAMPMKNFCDAHELGTWELALCLGAAPVIGRFFMLDPRYGRFRSMLLDQKGTQGRDKALNMLMAGQSWLNSLK